MPKGYPKNGPRVGAQGNLSRTPEYAVWCAMKRRCLNPEYPLFKDYGGRGITVCAEWRDSFSRFLEDMGKRPTPKHSIERENNDGNYEPSNCVWATREEQSRNRRSNIKLTHDGLTMNMAEWSRHLAIPYGSLQDRFYRGLSTPEILTRTKYKTGPKKQEERLP
jgi:hypothetical protein